MPTSPRRSAQYPYISYHQRQQRFVAFQKPWFLAAFFGYFLSLVKESNPPEVSHQFPA